MIFWIFVIALVVGIVLFVLSDNCSFFYNWDTVAVADICISIITIVTMGIIIVATHVTANGEKLANEQRYDSLIYKAETESIRDEFGIVNKEYIDEVQAWNENVIKYKEWQRDFWIGIFIPNIYDDFETIDLGNIQFKEQSK